MVDEACELLPITDWCLEVNKFSFMRMEDGSICGIDYQNGRLKGYKDTKEYIFAEQHGVCACCGKPIEHYHHIVPRHNNGFDGPENLVGLCNNCHTQVHKGKLKNKIKKIGEEKKYAALSILSEPSPPGTQRACDRMVLLSAGGLMYLYRYGFPAGRYA